MWAGVNSSAWGRNISEATCTFYDPISEDTLTEFSNSIGYRLPSDGYLKIGYFYQENIFIDLKLFGNGEKNYLFVKEHISQFSEGRPLSMNFELWFDRFVISQGTKFWNYPIYTAETYHTADFFLIAYSCVLSNHEADSGFFEKESKITLKTVRVGVILSNSYYYLGPRQSARWLLVMN